MAIPIIATLLTDEEFELFINKCISKSVKEELKALLAVPESINTIPTRQETAKLLAISLPTLHDYTKRGLTRGLRKYGIMIIVPTFTIPKRKIR